VSEPVEITIIQHGHDDRIVGVPEGATRVGRAEDNEIVLSDVGVSRRHAQVYVSGGEVTVEDLGSGNGTYFNGYRIQSQPVQDGDEVVIDPFTLRFKVQLRQRPTGASAPRRPDMVPRSPTPQGRRAAARLDIVAGTGVAGTSFPLTTRGLSIGRSEDRDVVIPDPAASRHHCQIALQAGEWVLRDMGSANGVFVNGVRVRECMLADGDLIRIGNTEMRFVAPGLSSPAISPAGSAAWSDTAAAMDLSAERTARHGRGRPLVAMLLGGAFAFVAMLVVLAAIVGGVLYTMSQQTPPPVVYEAKPPRWELKLPPSLAAAPVDELFEQGRGRMRERDMKAALQDFYRVVKADPSYPHVDKFAAAAGEALVLEALEKELTERIERREERSAQRDRLLETHRKGTRAQRAAAERTLRADFAADPVVVATLDLPPPPADAEQASAIEAAIDLLQGDQLDAAAALFSEVLRTSEDSDLRKQALAQLKLIQPNIARTSAPDWQRGVLAEARGDAANARLIFAELASEHPSNPSARAHLDRL
jgi:pSer/pThr/pTyr-binding forkhead associated (FHA) protein